MTAEEGKHGPHNTEAVKALERFVVENDDLLTLESCIGKFNIFDALGITRVEIRHSYFLAFILDPAESHGQGQLSLKAVLMDLLKNVPPELRPLSPIDLDGTDLRGVEIRREWKNIDLLIACKEPRFIVVIENKVDSGEHSDQLSRYPKIIREHYSEDRPLYIYLTPEGDEPTEETKETWLPYSYKDLYCALNRVRERYHGSIGDEVLVFLDHYLNLLRTRFMNDKDIDDLCQKIHRNHRQALDLIWERVGSSEAGTLVEMAKILEQDARWHLFSRSSKFLSIVPKTWLEWLPPFGPEDDPQRWIIVELASKETRLTYAVYVLPMRDAAKLRGIVTKLREESIRIGFKPTKAAAVGANYARIAASERIKEWGKNEQPGLDAIHLAVKKALDDLYTKLE